MTLGGPQCGGKGERPPPLTPLGYPSLIQAGRGPHLVPLPAPWGIGPQPPCWSHSSGAQDSVGQRKGCYSWHLLGWGEWGMAQFGISVCGGESP